jgi:thiol-disulfide isomerase/thioredoxin
MRSFGALAVMLSVLWLGGCGKKETPAGEKSTPKTQSDRPSVTPKRPPAPRTHRFRIRDIDRRETLLEFTGKRAVFHRIRQPLVLITLFSEWCPPCRGMLPYLSRLQAANRDDLFVIGVLVRSDLDTEGLRDFMLRYDTNFFISNHPDSDRLGDYLARRNELGENYPLPLTLIYKNGTYLMHISGAVPYEMLQTLVDQLKEKKERKE